MNHWSQWTDDIIKVLTGSEHLGLEAKAVLALLAGLLCWLILKTVMHVLKKRLDAGRLPGASETILKAIRKLLNLSLLLALGSYLIALFQFRILDKLYPAVFVILFAGPVVRVFLIFIDFLKKKWADNTETKVDNILFDLLERFSGAIIYVVAAVIALDILGINVMPFVAGAGVLGVAVGFAAKDTLSNLIAGILLIIDRPFEIGDRIEVWSAPAGSATWGDVIDIGLRATKIQTTDNIIIVIPNNEIMTRDIVNYTLISTKIRVRINIGVSYDTDIEKAKAAIVGVAADTPWISKTPAPKVVVRNFGESSVDLQLRVWIENARDRMNTISHITDKVKAVFDREGIEIPYPKRDIHIIRHISNDAQPSGSGTADPLQDME